MRHARGGAATGLMWLGLVPLVFVKVWLVYVTLVSRGAYWESAYGHVSEPDALAPLPPVWGCREPPRRRARA